MFKSSNPRRRIEDIDYELELLPKGTLTYKKINGKSQPYIQRTIDGRSVSSYVKSSERERVLLEFDKKEKLLEEKKRLKLYCEGLSNILEKNPYLGKSMGLGYMYYSDYYEHDLFYVDKTHFITEWVNTSERVTLITRPRRFGKTLLMSTVEHFFDPKYKNIDQRFESLRVWKSEKCRNLYGTTPVIFINFCAVKSRTYDEALSQIKTSLGKCYSDHDYLKDSTMLSDEERKDFDTLRYNLTHGGDADLFSAIPVLSMLLYRHFDTLPIILLDEYDTPLTEAYTAGYLEDMLYFCKVFFNRLFKENSYYYRAVITGVAKVAKNSLFSDMNNIYVCSCTSDRYSDCFGFTEQEVMDALKCQNIGEVQKVKEMYDGFIFGKSKDIYNPWSVCCYMNEGILKSYWTMTAENDIVGDLIRKHSKELKRDIVDLLMQKSVHKRIDEDVALQYLDGNDDSFWSLMLAAGYIKADNVIFDADVTECDITITNRETLEMFRNQALRMIEDGTRFYNDFIAALLERSEEELNIILNDIVYMSASYYDTGRRLSERTPENFYHGLVLGLIAALRDRYRIISNRESGRGRYDIAMYPVVAGEDAFIMEFKVRNPKTETSLFDTAQKALDQIINKNYEADLVNSGIEAEKICKLGLGFEGKEAVVILSQPNTEMTGIF